MWKNEKFTLTQIFFRQINYLVTFSVRPNRAGSAESSANHTVEITKIYFRAFLAKISWKQGIY